MEEPASGSAFSSVQEIGHEQALSAALGPDKYTTSSFAQQPLGDREGINIQVEGQGQATAQAMPTKSAEVPDVPCALQRMRDVAAGAAPLCQIPPYARQRKQVEFAVYDAKVTRTTNELRQEEMAKQARAVGEALQLKIRSAAEYANAQGRCTAAAQAVQQTKAALAEELDELQWAELVAQREAQQQRDRLWGALQLKQDELRLYICQHQISDAPSVLQIAATPTASQPMNQQPGHTRKPGRPTKRKLVSGAGPRPFDTAPKSSRRGWDGASPGAGATNGPASAAGAAEGTLGLQHVACASKEAAQRLETPAQGSLAAATDADMHQSLSSLARRFRPIAAHAESGGADMDRSLSSLARRAGPPAGRAGSGSAAAAASAPRRAERSRAAQLPNENLAAAAHSDIAANDNAALEVEQMRKLKTHLQTLGVQLGSGWHAQVLFHLTGHLAGMPYFQYYNAADQRFRSMKEVARSLGASVARDT
ncbi:hypothetical protein WJX72_002464 [[Myrmecia] bisecta]|uniref:Uncharacterized protein n=1 Tax=[Myrmecia] bisecta TaxID=41462 RepID=A0AAW1PGS6_9CHLO